MVMACCAARGSRQSGAGAGSCTEFSHRSWISLPISVQVIALVIDQDGVTRSGVPNSLYRSVKTRSGVAIRIPYRPGDPRNSASSAAATCVGGCLGAATASPTGHGVAACTPGRTIGAGSNAGASCPPRRMPPYPTRATADPTIGAPNSASVHRTVARRSVSLVSMVMRPVRCATASWADAVSSCTRRDRPPGAIAVRHRK